VDAVGNTSSASLAASVTIDTVAPVIAIGGESSSNAVSTLAKAGDVITTTFTSTDSVTSVTIGGKTAAVTDLGNGSYKATYTVASGDNATSTAVVVNSVDAAGNTNSASLAASVTIDTVAPTAPVINTAGGANVFASAVQVSLTGVANDVAATTVTVSDAAGHTAVATNNAGTWTANLAGLDRGALTVTADVADAAGNHSIATQTVYSSISAAVSAAAAGSTVTIAAGN